jgi:hypothetical protein
MAIFERWKSKAPKGYLIPRSLHIESFWRVRLIFNQGEYDKTKRPNLPLIHPSAAQPSSKKTRRFLSLSHGGYNFSCELNLMIPIASIFITKSIRKIICENYLLRITA